MDRSDVIRRIIEFVDIPTTATDPAGQLAGAEWLRGRLRSANFSTSVRGGPGSPFVIGRLDRASAATLVVYVMYDTREPTTERHEPARIADLAPLGRCLVTSRPIGNKAAIELFLTAVGDLAKDPECPSLLLVAEGSELAGSPGLTDLMATDPDLLRSTAKSVFWPRASQSATGQARLNLAYRGMLGLTLTASGRASGRGPTSTAVHSQYRPWVDAPSWRLIAAVNSLVTDDGNEMALSLPQSSWPLPPPPRSFDPGRLLANLGVASFAPPVDTEHLWSRLARPSVNVELVGTVGPGVGLIQPVAAAKLQFRLPPAFPTRIVVEAIRSHLDEHGWADIAVEVTYALDGASTTDQSPVVQAAHAMYVQHEVPVELWPIATGTAPTCAFASLGYNFADGGLGHQDELGTTLVVEDSGQIAGIDRSIAGYSTFLKAYSRAVNHPAP